jgi:hypothetical protein
MALISEDKITFSEFFRKMDYIKGNIYSTCDPEFLFFFVNWGQIFKYK